MEALRRAAARFKQEFEVYRRVLRDARTPWLAKLLLGLAVGYVLMPFDLIPDFIPVIGHLDDLVIVPLLVVMALQLIPPHIVQDYRREMGGQHD